MKRFLHYVCLYLLCAGGLASCTKKEDFAYDNRVNPQADAASSVRIVNMRGATELMVNGKQLSAFALPNIEGFYDQYTTKATPWFPETGRMGLTYTIPQQFVSADGTVKDIRFAAFTRDYSLGLTRGFNAKDNFNNPTDYYFAYFGPNASEYSDSLFAIPRSVSPPANPAYCKVRLLNLSSTNSAFGGTMRVTWADGTVIAGLDNIPVGQYSDYVELPYGTYQLKVMTMDGLLVPGVGGSAQFLNVVNPQTGTMLLPGTLSRPSVNGFVDSRLTFAPLKTYQPGGVYTIAVADCPNFRNSNGGTNGETYSSKNNAFRIIADAEPQNNSYARLQAINVVPGKQIKVTMDGRPLGNTLGFSTTTAFDQYLIGTHILKVTDAAGNLLADSTFSLLPGDNRTAWIYENKNGKTGISLVANNLSNVYYTGATEDGSYSNIKVEFPSWVRFMNFCPDLPEATFTTDDGQTFGDGSASQHLLLGIPAIKNPYVMLNANFYQSIWAYASQYNVVPGNWLREVTTLKSRDFIANPALYPGGLPMSESGVYTVALIGNINTSKPGSEKARMIIIRHNQ
ncbi:hypothetical protein [Chitinophaga sp. HK235]|uniref:hypothetical protein n=1 Tax=Chitinophaga sp. HK235 TaxID=2952571 RepID=UPI001BA5B9D0|nr:hypothetical protein [Chitinophaga sp. HK235]